MLDFIIRYWIEIFFGLILGIVSLIHRKLCNYKKMLDNTNVGVKVLLRTKIMELYTKLLTREYITLCEKETINEAYEIYQNLGGDAVSKELIEEINNAPVKISKIKKETTLE